MRAFQDKATGKWKWGTRGEPIYDSQKDAERGGMQILTDRLRKIRDQLDGVYKNHGRV